MKTAYVVMGYFGIRDVFPESVWLTQEGADARADECNAENDITPESVEDDGYQFLVEEVELGE